MASPAPRRLILRNAAQVVCVARGGERVKCGSAMGDVAVLENASVVVGGDGRIEAVGPAAEIEAAYASAAFDCSVDASGKCVVPGFVDGHTHPVWSGDRVHEFAMKLAGASYLDIHKAGGGIQFTVDHTRRSPPEELLGMLLPRLDRMLATGTTLVEAKSGYGLEAETEVKMLQVLAQAGKTHPVEISATFLGAHSVPRGSTEEAAAADVVERQLPAVLAARDAGTLAVDAIDVFCEKGVFERESTERILRAGKAAGLRINFHGDELAPMASGELGAEVGATAVSHLERVSEEGMRAMAAAGVVGVLLPTTAYILRLDPPPARRMIELGVPVALGSDFNPNAHCTSMPLVMHLACILLRMSMPEALTAATLNAAASVGRADTHGSIEKGKLGDLVLVDAPAWEHLVYRLGDPPVAAVFKAGRKVAQAGRPCYAE